MRKIILTTLIGIILTIGLSVFYFVFFQQEQLKTTPPKSVPYECLDDNKKASYKSEDKDSVLADLTVSVKDKSSGRELSSFKIDNVYRTVPRAELHKCGVYVIRFFNYDSKKSKQDPSFKVEIWKYQYNGKGTPFFYLSGGEESSLAKEDYSYAFRIDPQEKYLILEKGYLGRENYSLVIKNLETKEDIFILSAKEIFKQYPNIIGNFNMRKWTKDGRYFWGDIFQGAYVKGFFRIDTTNWNAEIFPAPKDVLGGDALNVENGYITVHPGNVWFGIAELTEEEKARRRAQGIGTELYVYNLFTGERHFVDKTDEPLWYFKPKWTSDTELEYELPTGQKKIYIVQ